MTDERLIVAPDFHHFGDVKNLVNERGLVESFVRIDASRIFETVIDEVKLKISKMFS